ncbi:universal stress protein [Actinomadura welshii]
MTEHSRPNRILVGVDGSAASLAALRWAVDEAARRDAEILAVRAWRPRRGWSASYVPGVRRHLLDRERQRARRALAADVRSVLGPARRVQVREELAYGDAVRVLLARAARADLLVLGGPTDDPALAGVIGFVRAACLKRAPCRVVLIREGRAPSASSPAARVRAGVR